MRRTVMTGLALAMALTLAAAAQDPTPPIAAPQERAKPALDAAVSSGAALYASTCAACHAADLAGSAVPPSFSGYEALRAPPLNGPCALRGFASAAELLAYVRYDMPIQAPGSLSNGEARD